MQIDFLKKHLYFEGQGLEPRIFSMWYSIAKLHPQPESLLLKVTPHQLYATSEFLGKVTSKSQRDAKDAFNGL